MVYPDTATVDADDAAATAAEDDGDGEDDAGELTEATGKGQAGLLDGEGWEATAEEPVGTDEAVAEAVAEDDAEDDAEDNDAVEGGEAGDEVEPNGEEADDGEAALLVTPDAEALLVTSDADALLVTPDADALLVTSNPDALAVSLAGAVARRTASRLASRKALEPSLPS